MPAKRKSRRTVAKKPAITSSPLEKHFLTGLGVVLALVAIFVFSHYYVSESEPIEKTRKIVNDLELQIALAREGFSPGSIDGKLGEQTTLALSAYQKAKQLPVTGSFDDATANSLMIDDPVFVKVELTKDNLDNIDPKPQSWIERGQLDAMRFNSVLEMIAERSQTDPDTVVELNPSIDWQTIKAGTQILVPRVPLHRIQASVAYVRIQLSKRVLQAYDKENRLCFHSPVSIARRIDKRPSGLLQVKVLVEDPNYTFNPEILSGTAAREGISQKFIIQPGPNNPVGNVWIGLNLPSYGIHGTPEPENVGRTESSGCFRLANWNAQTLLEAAWVGMPIYVDP
ncbi:MAG: L,D-transpeptidase family protein [Opitutaceae bacterium]